MAVTAARAPLRVALGGGGTDLPAYYREHGGFVVSTAIDRYVQVALSTSFQQRFRLKHLEWEEVDAVEDVRHPILRETLKQHWRGGAIELASVADAPPGTGLGSSGAYAVCAIKALELAGGVESDPGTLAEAACEIEIDLLGRKVGKQDQYAAAFGGVRAYTFNPDDSVSVRDLDLPAAAVDALRERFLLFFSGRKRSASDLLSGTRMEALERLHELALQTCAALEAGDLAACGELMKESWEAKRERAPGTVLPEMDDLRDRALRSSGTGVLSLGAGGGGFLLVLTDDPENTRRAMHEAGAPELSFGLDEAGCVGLDGSAG